MGEGEVEGVKTSVPGSLGEQKRCRWGAAKGGSHPSAPPNLEQARGGVCREIWPMDKDGDRWAPPLSTQVGASGSSSQNSSPHPTSPQTPFPHSKAS